MRRSKPKQPPGLADFIAKTVRHSSLDIEKVYDTLCEMVREAASTGGRYPSNARIAKRLGVCNTAVRDRMETLRDAGRVLQFGRNATSVQVPNEPEFTKGLEL